MAHQMAIAAENAAALPLLARFPTVWLEDSSTISLPGALATIWQGCGGNTSKSQAPMTEASLKLGVRYNLRQGNLQGPVLVSARPHDRHTPLRQMPMEAESLWIADLGYFALDWLKSLREQQVHFLIRLKDPIMLWVKGQRQDLLEWLRQSQGKPQDLWVDIGAHKELHVRLLAFPVPAEAVEKRQERIRENARRHQKEAQARAAGVKVVAIPALGAASADLRAEEQSRPWKRAYRWRAGIEGRIHSLRRDYGLGKCAYHGQVGMERWVGLGVLASNLRRIAQATVA